MRKIYDEPATLLLYRHTVGRDNPTMGVGGGSATRSVRVPRAGGSAQCERANERQREGMKVGAKVDNVVVACLPCVRARGGSARGLCVGQRKVFERNKAKKSDGQIQSLCFSSFVIFIYFFFLFYFSFL